MGVEVFAANDNREETLARITDLMKQVYLPPNATLDNKTELLNAVDDAVGALEHAQRDASQWNKDEGEKGDTMLRLAMARELRKLVREIQ